MKKLLSTITFAIIFSVLGFVAYMTSPMDSDASPLELSSANQQREAAAPAAAQNLNMIAIPLDVSAQFTNAQGLATYLGTGITEISKWNPAFQVFETWYSEFNDGDLFSVETGDALWILANSSSNNVVSFVGDVPPQTGQTGAVQFDLVGGTPCKLNAISIPLDQSSITTQSELVTALGGYPDVEEISKWNAEFQVYETWYAEFDDGDSFEVKVGHPFFICLSGTASPSWP